MSQHNFDQIIDRTGTASTKWDKYPGAEVLPFWVADMDFATPQFVFDAIQTRLQHPILGYTNVPDELPAQACDWLARSYGWQISSDWLVWLPGVVTGLNLAARAMLQPGDALVVPAPVYFPFREVAGNQGFACIEPRLTRQGDEWVMDLEHWQSQLSSRARALLLCNPQNPTGRVYREAELRDLLAFCQQHELLLCSDEIHADLVLVPGQQHVPIASLDADFAKHTISLFAPTKTFNMPGLGCAFAVIPDPQLRQRFRDSRAGLVHGPGVLSYAAASAAFTHDGQWLHELQRYLQGNHEQLLQLIELELPGRMTPVQATYLAWLDLREFAVADLETFWVSQGLALSDGGAFGAAGFSRFNFACPRSLLDQGLERLQQGLRELKQTKRTESAKEH